MSEHKQGSIYAELEPRAPILEGSLKRYLEAQKRILEGSVQKPKYAPQESTLEPHTPILEGVPKTLSGGSETHPRGGQSRRRPAPASPQSSEPNIDAVVEPPSSASSDFMYHTLTSFVTHRHPGNCAMCSLSAASSCLWYATT